MGYKNHGDKPVNVWRAKHRETGEIHYAVALYDAEQNHYTSPLTKSEQRLHPDENRVGDFSSVAKYRHETRARLLAREKYGYSRVGDARRSLGAGYGHSFGYMKKRKNDYE